MNTSKRIILLLCSLLTAVYVHAQSIRNQIQQDQWQQQREREQRAKEVVEQTRIRKSHLNLTDLLQLLQSSDLEYVDKYLTERGWKLSTNTTKTTSNFDGKLSGDYQQSVWTFDQDEWRNTAKSWFYFNSFSDNNNAITYTITDEEHVNRLRTELEDNGYGRIYSTNVVENGLESVYRNSLYEVTFKKQVGSEWREEDISYSFFVYGYKQIEERKAQEEKYRNAISRAESAYSQELYAMAKQAYEEALTVKPENREMLSEKMIDIDINILCKEGENLIQARRYDDAKAKFTGALAIKPNRKIDFINKQIRMIADLQLFVKERTHKQYDYKTIEANDYRSKMDNIENELRNALATGGEILPQTTVNIVCRIDTLGNTVTSYTTSAQNQNLNAILDKISKNIKLKQASLNGYTVSAKAEFPYTINHNHATITVKKNHSNITSHHSDFTMYRSEIGSELSNGAPYGQYTFDMNKTTINGQVYNNHRLMNMKNTGGPANALLSLFVPGLGDSRVSYGQKSGIGIALSTYALIGAGVGLKMYSNSEYKKYHAATEQAEMDKYYKSANNTHLAFYACVITGGIIWLYDIIWVWNEGTQNTKAHNAYRRSHVGLYSDPTLNATGLSYTINF